MNKQDLIRKCRDLSEHGLENEVVASFACPPVADISLEESRRRLDAVTSTAKAWTDAADAAFYGQPGDAQEVFEQNNARRTMCKNVIGKIKGRLTKALQRHERALQVFTDRQLADCTLKRRTTAVTS